MNTEMTSPTANLVGRWGLDEGTGSAIADSSGNGVNGTTIASPAWVDGFNVAPPVGGAERPAVRRLERLRRPSARTSSLGRDAVHAGDLVQARRDRASRHQRAAPAVSPAVPLIAKGRSENDTPANVNMNYFLGIDTAQPSGRRLRGRRQAVRNHPIHRPPRRSPQNVWHHAAVTYDGNVWRIYLDGVSSTAPAGSRRNAAVGLDPARLARNRPELHRRCRRASSRACSTKSRIWNVARTGAQIQAAMSTQIGVPTAGLRRPLGHERDQRAPTCPTRPGRT